MAKLEINNITKRFGPLVANDDISLNVSEGEVVALLGENGAGKTTLMNILFGHYIADGGSIKIDGKTLPPGSTDAAIKAGVGMVHQHFTLADNMSVLENIILGTESLWSWRSAVRAARDKLAKLAKEYDLYVNPDDQISQLSVGERQRVEILKVLYRGAKTLILDEPTAVLTPAETGQLLANLKAMVANGMSIIFISHKLHEVLEISDRVFVLRHGALVGEIKTSKADKSILAQMMVGRKVTRPKAEKLKPGSTILELDNISVIGERGNGPILNNISFKIHQNEIVAIAGVSGNGQRELAETLNGLRQWTSGQLKFNNQEITRASARDFLTKGFARIPEDRHNTGTIGEMSVWENLVSEKLRQRPFWKFGKLIDFAINRKMANDLIKKFDIRCASIDTPARLLSGGNMQKLILSRTLTTSPKFILANQPVRGLDEGAIAFVHEQLLTARSVGAGILLISEDLDEIFAIADRVAVIYRGRLSDVHDIRKTDISQIGAMMGGDIKVVA